MRSCLRNNALTFQVIASSQGIVIHNNSYGSKEERGEADKRNEQRMRNRKTGDHVLRKSRWRIRGKSLRFAEQHWKFSSGAYMRGLV